MIRALLLWLMLALPAAAQSLPDWDYTSINDFAGLLTNDDTRVLDQALIALHADTGVEGTVVTIKDRQAHGGNSGLEAFATRLFNYWGVGDKRRNDGFMVMVLRDNREARIELGAGYPPAYDSIAQQIMDNEMLPAFRNGYYSTGLRHGTLAVIERIARPHAEGVVPDPMPARSNGPSMVPPLIFLGFMLVFFVGLFSFVVRSHSRATKTQYSSAYYQDDDGELHSYRSSSYSSSSDWSSGSSSSSSSGGGYGGGSSSGGGASGRW